MTDIAAILTELGFEASTVGEQANKIVVKVWTSKGWVYERFSSDVSSDDVAAWAKDKVPG